MSLFIHVIKTFYQPAFERFLEIQDWLFDNNIRAHHTVSYNMSTDEYIWSLLINEDNDAVLFKLRFSERITEHGL